MDLRGTKRGRVMKDIWEASRGYESIFSWRFRVGQQTGYSE